MQLNKNYLEMIKFQLEKFYIKRKFNDTHKALVFCGTVKLAIVITEYLRELYTDLKINK